MKITDGLIIVIILGWLPVCSINAQERSGGDTYQLMGPVRTARWEEAKYSDQSGKWMEGPRVLTTIFTFDAKGRFIEDIRYDSEGRKHVLRYEKGEITAEEIYKADGALQSKQINTFDDKRRLREMAYYDADGLLLSKTVYSYDDKDRLSEIATYQASNSLLRKEVYSYDDQGKLIEVASYKGDNSLLGKQRYDANPGQSTGVATNYNADGSVSNVITSTRDATGNEIERAHYKADGTLDRIESFSYEANGKEKEIAGYKADGSLQYRWRPVYEYDSHGNWIKKTVFTWVTKNGRSYFEPTVVTYRTITYY